MRLHPGGTLLHWGENYPTKDALTIGDKTKTYGELLDKTLLIVAYFQKNDVAKGDRVVIVINSSFEYVEILYACMILGAVAVPLDFNLPFSALKEMIGDAEPRLVLVSAAYSGLDAMLELNGSPNHVIVTEQLYSESEKDNGIHLIRSMPRDQILHEDTVGILYSSGTTGKPKGIQKTYYQLISELFVWITELQIGFEKKLLVCAPFYYTGGFLLLLSSMFIGAHLVLLEDFDPTKWLDIVSTMEISHAFLNPTQSKRILSIDPSPVRPTHLELIVTISDATTGETKTRLSTRFNCGVMDAWGNTEGAGTIAKPRDVQLRPNTIGKPFLTDEIRILDNQLQELGVGEIGEIAGKSDSSFVYFKQPETTSQTIKNGWILSGDLGWKDEAGYVYFAGRKKTMLKVSGANVYPADIESVLEQHPLVAEAAVFGIDDEDVGERPVAAVILKNNVADTKAAAKSIGEWATQRLSRQQQLKDVVVRDEFPRTAAGKIIRQRLLEEYISSRPDSSVA